MIKILLKLIIFALIIFAIYGLISGKFNVFKKFISKDFLYKENYEIIEDSYGYLICGTVKFVKPVEPCDEGYLCSLTSNIEAVDMKNGKKVFSKTFVHEATGKNWNSCVSKCKSELAKMIVDEIFFGM